MKYALLFILLAVLLPKPAAAQFPFEECSNTESWLPMGDGLPNQALYSATLNGDLYILSCINFYSDYVLSRWDGTSWREVSAFTAFNARGRADGVVSDMVVYNGDIYIRGCFDSINSIPGTSAFARWDGSAWHAVEGHPLDPFHQDIEFSKMTVYNGELVVTGPFKREDGLVDMGIHLWNGTRWLKIADDDHSVIHTDGLTDSLHITSFAEWRGDLYVGGWFNTIGGVSVSGVARWDGARWSAVGHMNSPFVHSLFVLHDRLYAVHSLLSLPGKPVLPDDEHIVEWDGTSWRNVAGILPLFRKGNDLLYSPCVAVFDDAAYISTSISSPASLVEFIDLLVRWDGTAARPCAHMNRGMNVLAVHDGMLVAGGYFTASCGEPLRGMAKLCIGHECSGISGRVISGQTGDCDHDSVAPGVAGRILRFDSLGYAITEADGFYRRYTDVTGDHAIALAPVRHRGQTCPVAPPYRVAHIETVGDSSVGNNFAVWATPNVRDLQVGVVCGRARRGGALEYVVSCRNVGTVPATSYTLTFLHDPLLTYQVSSVEPSRVWDAGVEWEMGPIGVDESQIIRVTFMVPTDLALGEEVCASIHSDDRDDAWPADNIDSVCTPVLASYDPNDIAVQPPGSGTDGIIQSHDSVLTYTVRFQNTGNDTAFRVVVYDTLDRNLDLASLVLGPSSHPFKLHIEGTSALAWEFNDIGLPDSTRDLVRSQGFFKYSVRLRRGLSPNTRIANSAEIYFDYNDPVITNTVLSTTPAPASGVGRVPVLRGTLSLHPNPTHGVAHLRGDIVAGSAIEVRDMLGRIVRSVRHEEGDETRLDLEGLAAGTYVVSARTATGDASVRVTLVR